MAEQKLTGTQALASILKPLLDDMEQRLKQHTTVEITALNLTIKDLQTENKLITAALAGAKKAIPREKKEPVTVAGAGVGAAATITQKTAIHAFPANKLVWFKKKYTTDEQYRAGARAACGKVHMDKIDEEVKARPDGDAKLSATATLIWAIVKDNTAYYDDQIVRVHKAEKDLYDASLKAPSVVVEADSPPTGRNTPAGTANMIAEAISSITK